MNILESILKEGGGALVGALAKNMGINPKLAEAAIKQLTPALTRGLSNNMKTEQGTGSLLDALSRGNHERTLNDFGTLNLDDTINEGNEVLGHILKGKDVSRNVAGAAAKKAGVSSGILKKMLPVLAMVVMGMMKRKTSSAGTSRKAGGGLLRTFLDSDGDGSIIDDILSLAVKFF
ncbi:MAG: DUF937 domain-containing protein [Arenicellales bacterium]